MLIAWVCRGLKCEGATGFEASGFSKSPNVPEVVGGAFEESDDGGAGGCEEGF